MQAVYNSQNKEYVCLSNPQASIPDRTHYIKQRGVHISHRRWVNTAIKYSPGRFQQQYLERIDPVIMCAVCVKQLQTSILVIPPLWWWMCSVSVGHISGEPIKQGRAHVDLYLGVLDICECVYVAVLSSRTSKWSVRGINTHTILHWLDLRRDPDALAADYQEIYTKTALAVLLQSAYHCLALHTSALWKYRLSQTRACSLVGIGVWSVGCRYV